MSEVLVACGGRSLEREVSLRSGRNAHSALRQLGHVPTLFDVDRTLVDRIIDDRPDFVFIAMHGLGGEDGTIQDLLEILKVPYTGSDALASGLCLDKHAFKVACVAAGVDTPRWHSFTQHAFSEFGAAGTVGALIDELGLPLVVKPARQGSSLGLRIVEDENAFGEAVVSAMSYDDRVIVEQFIPGREIAVTVMGPAADPEALPIVEIKTSEPYYTFAAHYEIGVADIVSADLDPDVREATCRAAVAAYSAAGCRDFARVDIRLDADRPSVLEINTIPGLTQTGPASIAADLAGLSFAQFIGRICERVTA